MIYDLCGKWQFRNISTDDGEWLDANVPSTNYTDLLNAGKIPDPFIGTNEKLTEKYGDYDWEYIKRFDVSSNMLSAERIEICAEMLDTVFEMYLNGKEIYADCNAFIGYRIDVKNSLVLGENELKIIFRSPTVYANTEMKRINGNATLPGFKPVAFIRKPQYQFGWDWGPIIPVSGIAKPIYIDYGSKSRIDDLYIEQVHADKVVTLKVNATIIGNSSVYYKLRVIDPNGNIIEKEGSANNNLTREIIIDNPQLWWTQDLMPRERQPLYTVELEISDENEIIDTSKRRIGLRTIELDRSKDEYGSNFRFIVNGEPIFAKGANWIPAHSMQDAVDIKRLTYHLDAAKLAGFNMIRVWGGGFYESDDFYTLCDERGILVWQDFMFACSPYPLFDEKYVTNALREVEYNVKRLRNHPSLAIWSGNNEIEAMSTVWSLLRNYVLGTKKFFWETLKDEVRKFDAYTPYIAGSPVGVEYNKGVSADNVGDTHLWAVWHGLQDVKYYRKRFTRFCSEFGFESLPDLKTVKEFSDGAPFDIFSDVFLTHQKCVGGNAKTEYYVASRFRLPRKPEDIVYLSQACQAESIKDATEFWRRNRPRTNGAIYWQFDDCWPVASWSSIDYYGNYKALQYQARHFNAPLAVSIDDGKEDIKLYVLNDTLANRNIVLKYSLVDFTKGVLDSKEKSLDIAPNSVVVGDVIMRSNLKKYSVKHTLLVAEIFENGECVNRKTMLFAPEKKVLLPKANIEMTTVVEGDKIEITLRTDSYARLVCVSNSVSTLPLSDNYMDMLPGETLKLSTPYYDNYKPEDFSVMSVSDVEAGGSKLKDSLKRLIVFLNPSNMAQWVYYSQASFEYKE